MICVSCGFEFNDELQHCPRCAAPAQKSFEQDAQSAVVPPPAAEQPIVAQPVNVQPQPQIIGESRPEDNMPVQPQYNEDTSQHTPGEFQKNAAEGLSHAAEFAKKHVEAAGGAISHIAVEAKKQAGDGISHVAQSAKKHVEDAGGIDGIKDNAKRFAEKSGGEAKSFFGKAGTAAGSFLKSRHAMTAAIIILSIIVLIMIFGSGDDYTEYGLLLALLTAALTLAICNRADVRSQGARTRHSGTGMQTVNTGDYTYLLNARGEVYMLKNGGDKTVRLDMSDVGGIFADSRRIYACKTDGSLVAADHGGDNIAQILSAGSIYGGRASASSDGFVYFSSARVQGNPVCRVSADGGAVHIVTD